jgi:hypothetical protein
MIVISPYARDAMRQHIITEDEVISALADGKTEFEIFVKGEKRYGNVLIEKQRKLVVIWTWRKAKKRIITCYPLRREI